MKLRKAMSSPQIQKGKEIRSMNTSPKRKADDSDDPFNEEDYGEPKRSLRKNLKSAKVVGQKSKQKPIKIKKVKKRTKTNLRTKQIEHLKEQLKIMQASIDNLSHPQFQREGDGATGLSGRGCS